MSKQPRAALMMRFGKHLACLCIVCSIGFGVFWISRSVSRSSERSAALRLAEAKKFAEALPRLRIIVESDPEDAEALKGLVECLIGTGAVGADIVPYLSRWCELRRDDPVPYQLRRDALFALGRGGDWSADS